MRFGDVPFEVEGITYGHGEAASIEEVENGVDGNVGGLSQLAGGSLKAAPALAVCGGADAVVAQPGEELEDVGGIGFD